MSRARSPRAAAALFAVGFLGLVAPAPAQDFVAQHYVLDGFGGVHAGGGAPLISPGTPYFGFDIAADIAHVPGTGGDGILVLDRLGGVHRGGAVSSYSAVTPYFGFDVARAIVYRNVPPRAVNNASAVPTSIAAASAIYTVIASATIEAPDDGFLLVTGTVGFACTGVLSTVDLTAELTLNVDSTSEPAAISNLGLVSYPSCPPSTTIHDGRTLTHLFFVGAGTHVVNLLARKVGGSADLQLFGRSVTGIFIDQNSLGAS